jgi:hypothetical protein
MPITDDSFEIHSNQPLDQVDQREGQIIVAYLLGEGNNAPIDDILCFADSPAALKKQLEDTYSQLATTRSYRLLIHWCATQEEINTFADNHNQKSDTERRVVSAAWEAHRATMVLRNAANGGSAFAKKSLEGVARVADGFSSDKAPSSKKPRAKREVIFIAIALELEKHEYCRALSMQGLQTLKSWQKKGCPADYLAAWNKPKGNTPKGGIRKERWTDIISKEHHAYAVRYLNISSSQKATIEEKAACLKTRLEVR